MKRTYAATGGTFETDDEHDDGDVEDRLSKAESTIEEFRDWPVAERGTTLAEATLLRGRTGEYAEQMTREMSNPIAYAESGIKEFVDRKTVWRQQRGRPTKTR